MKSTGEIFAMKVLSKKHIVDHQEVGGLCIGCVNQLGNSHNV